MATSLVNFRLDQDTKLSMEGICRDLGISMTAAFTLFAKKMSSERGIPFDVSLGPARPAAAPPGSLVAGVNHADPAIMVERLVRSFGEGGVQRKVLDGTSFEVRRGEFVAVMGPSGSGKSTLLHILGGVDAPTSGRVVVDGVDLTALGSDALALYRRRTVGLVYQFHNLIPFLSAQDNIELPLRFDGVEPDGAFVAELFGMLGLSGLEASTPSELSGGQRQRVAIARALVTRPAVVLADEPTGSLDQESGRAVMELLRESNCRYSQTIMLVTHDDRVASAADRIVSIADGRVVADGGYR